MGWFESMGLGVCFLPVEVLDDEVQFDAVILNKINWFTK